MPGKSIFGPVGYSLWTVMSLAIAVGAWSLSGHVLPEINRISYLTGCLGFAAACLTVPLALDFSYGWILKWTGGLSNFLRCEGHNPGQHFRDDLAPYFAPRRMYVVGAVWAIVAAVIVYRTTMYGQINHVGATSVGMVAVFAAEFQAGAALTALFGFARAIRRMGNRRNCTVRLSRDPFGILSTGSLMFKCWCIGLIIWMLYQIPIIVTSYIGANAAVLFLVPVSPA
jgi:hypothetical protein